MPYDYAYRNSHYAIPDAVTGYELAPLADKGLWSIVSPSGTVTNLNSLGFKVLAYTGAGMPPIENISTSLGVLGGSVLQRTVPRPRTFVLTCIAEGLTLAEVQRIKNRLIAQVAPYNSLQTSKALKLHYQLVNYCGEAIGVALEVAVTYAGDLTGSTDNLYQDRFELQFVEFAPPSIKELTTVQPSLDYVTTHATTQGIRYRPTDTGGWDFISLSSPNALLYDLTGDLWYSSTATIANRSGTSSQAVNAAVLALVADQDNNIYAGGAFTSPQSYAMELISGSWSALLASPAINGTVRAMCVALDGKVYIGGDFSSPQSHIIIYQPLGLGAWIDIGPADAAVRSMTLGLDGYVYIGGDFTGISTFSSNKVIAHKYPTGGFKDVGFASSTPSGCKVYALATLPDGRIVAGGDFSVINGQSVNYVAAYNGTSWGPLGNGFNNTVIKLAVNSATGELYALGWFTFSGTVALPGGIAKWNGSGWVPVDLANLIATPNLGGLAIRQSDGELAVSSNPTNADLTSGALNTIDYTGTADVFPQVKFTGPGTLYSITNYTTGKALYFNNYTLLSGETATFTHNPAGGITFTSSFFGNVLGRILPGSDVTSFSLIPGSNSIVPYVTGGTGATKVELIYQNTHFSMEAGAGTPE